MEFTINRDKIYYIIKPEENKLVSANSADLKAQFVFYNREEGYANAILDLSKVNFVDSSGLSAMLVGNRLSKEVNGTFVLASLQPNVVKMVKISQLDSVLVILPTVEEAIDYIKMDELTRQISGNGESI